MDRPESHLLKSRHGRNSPPLYKLVKRPDGGVGYETISATKHIENQQAIVEYWMAVSANGGDVSKVPKPALHVPPPVQSTVSDSVVPEILEAPVVIAGKPGIEINDLNDDCLLLLLKVFPLQKCIFLRGVCKLWKRIIEDNFLKPKQSIKCFSSERDVIFYCDEVKKHNLYRKEAFCLRDIGRGDDDLICKNGRAFMACSALFPALRRLTICHYNEDFPLQLGLANNIQKMPQLEEIVFFGLNSYQGGLQRTFWPTINHLPKLKELHFIDMGPFSRGDITTPNWTLPKDLWALERLTKFSLVDYPSTVGAVLQLLGPNTTELMLENVCINNRHFKLSLDANPMLERGLTHLTVGNVKSSQFDYLEFFTIISQRFKNLTHLDILAYRDIRLEQVLTEIVNLHHLEELSINVGWGPQNNFENIDGAPRLLTVRRLFIQDFTQVKAAFFLEHFPRIFSLINMLQFESLSDEICQNLIDSNIFSKFKHLDNFYPICPRMGNIHRCINKASIEKFAGRYSKNLVEHMWKENPFSKPLGKDSKGALLFEHYSEGEDSEAEMVAAVLEY